MASHEKGKLYLTALALVLVAIAAELVVKYHAGRGTMQMARAAAVPAERLRLHEAAASHVQLSVRCEHVSLGLGALAATCFLASRWRGEPGPRCVPILLGCIYVYLLLFIV